MQSEVETENWTSYQQDERYGFNDQAGVNISQYSPFMKQGKVSYFQRIT